MGLFSRIKSKFSKKSTKGVKPTGLKVAGVKIPSQLTRPKGSFNLPGTNIGVDTQSGGISTKPVSRDLTLPGTNIDVNTRTGGISAKRRQENFVDQENLPEIPKAPSAADIMAPVTPPSISPKIEPTKTPIAPITTPKPFPSDLTVAGVRMPYTAPTETPPTDTASQYRAAFEGGAPKGVDLDSAGPALGAVQTATQQAAGQPQPGQKGGTNLLDNIFNPEGQFPDVMKEFDKMRDFYKNQPTSLMDTYRELMKGSGLEDINERMLNLRNIIDGTRDDIAKEVQSAGGFSTSSQIEALTNSRNESLIEEYNNLLQTKQQVTEQIGNMMQYAQQDRQYASQQFEQRMGFEMKKLEYRDKMKQNAVEGYQRIIDRYGYGGLLKSLNQNEVGIVERTLGLGQGGLQRLASLPDPEAEEKALDRRYKEAQISNIYSQIQDRANQGNVNGTVNGKPQTATQSIVNSYANRMSEANVTLSSLGGQFTGKLAFGGSLPNIMQSADRQAYEQAKRNFMTALLRRESGAAISTGEFDTANKQYFPQAGDQQKVILQKEQSRNTAINNFYKEANAFRPVLPGDIVESGGKKYKVGIDGETLTEI